VLALREPGAEVATGDGRLPLGSVEREVGDHVLPPQVRADDGAVGLRDHEADPTVRVGPAPASDPESPLSHVYFEVVRAVKFWLPTIHTVGRRGPHATVEPL